MDLERARHELGLDPTSPASADTLRRAYLRAVRAHRPERDPEGFQRVRAAYELLQSLPWLLANEVAEPDALTRPSALVPSSAEPHDDSGSPSGSADSGVPRTEIPSEGAPSTYTPTPATPTPNPGVAHADTTHEGEARAPSDAAPALDAYQQRLVSLRQALEAGEVQRVAALLEEIYESAPHDAEWLPSPALSVDTVLALLELSEQAGAERLLQAFRRFQRARGSGARELQVQTTAKQLLAEELLAIADAAPKKVVRALAHSAREGKFFESLEVLEAHRNSELLGLLARDAPTIWGAVGPMLRPEPGRRSFRQGGGFSWLWVALIVGTSALRSAAGGCGHEHSTRHASPPSITQQAEPRARDKTPPRIALTEEELARSQKRQLDRVHARVEEAVTTANCAALAEQWPLYDAAVSASGYPASERSEVARLRSLAETTCPEQAKQLKEPE